MMLKRWEELPDDMRNDAVREYYDILAGKKPSLFFKRVGDIFLSFFLLLLFSPVFLLLAVIIKCDSKGPVFFLQTRVTAYGKTFCIVKFRTMVPDAEKRGARVTIGDDDRVTKIGRFLRKVRLDELPQLFNILKGDMTFVGTRPEVIQYVEHYTPEMRATLLLPAGVTSETSILYKDEDKLLLKASDPDETYIHVIMPKKMVYNLASLKSFGLMSDIRTMFRTVKAVLR